VPEVRTDRGAVQRDSIDDLKRELHETTAYGNADHYVEAAPVQVKESINAALGRF
jgi:hypothetical protein